MTIDTLTPPPTATRAAPADTDPRGAAPARLTGMACRNCGLTQPIALAYVCPACFGPLEVTYDLAVVAATLSHETIARRAPEPRTPRRGRRRWPRPGPCSSARGCGCRP